MTNYSQMQNLSDKAWVNGSQTQISIVVVIYIIRQASKAIPTDTLGLYNVWPIWLCGSYKKYLSNFILIIFKAKGKHITKSMTNI